MVRLEQFHHNAPTFSIIFSLDSSDALLILVCSMTLIVPVIFGFPLGWALQ